MTTIRKQDFVDSISDALQYISYYHSPDFVEAMHQAYLREQSETAKNAISQILINSRMCAEGRRPICQHTGIVVIFLKIGMDISWESDSSIAKMVNEPPTVPQSLPAINWNGLALPNRTSAIR